MKFKQLSVYDRVYGGYRFVYKRLGKVIIALPVLNNADLSTLVEGRKGGCYNHVRSNVDEYRRLRKQVCFLQKIVYCQRALQESANLSELFEKNELLRKSVFNHDFLVVATRTRRNDTEHFVAEKLGESKRNGGPGIHIRLLDKGLVESTVGSARLCEFTCDSEMSLDTIFGILEDYNPDYSLMDRNCWDYASKTTKKLLIASNNVKEAEVVRSKILKHHVQAMGKKMVSLLPTSS